MKPTQEWWSFPGLMGLGALLALIAWHAWGNYQGPYIPAYDQADSAHFWRIAWDPFTFEVAPFSYRLLIPIAVHLLPLPQGLGFLLVNSALLLATLLLSARYLRSFGFSPARARLGVGLLALSLLFWYALYNYTVADTLTYLCLVGAALAIRTRSHGAFWVWTIVGLLNRETSLFMLPVYFLTTVRADDHLERGEVRAFIRKAAVATVAGVAAGLALMAAAYSLRVAVLGPEFAFRNHLTRALLEYVMTSRLLDLSLIKHIVAQFTFFWPFIALNVFYHRENRRHLLLWAAYIIPVCLLIFITRDTMRMLAQLFPVLLPLALNGYSPAECFKALPKYGKVAFALCVLALAVPGVQYTMFYMSFEDGIIAAFIGSLFILWALRGRLWFVRSAPVRTLLPGAYARVDS